MSQAIAPKKEEDQEILADSRSQTQREEELPFPENDSMYDVVTYSFQEHPACTLHDLTLYDPQKLDLNISYWDLSVARVHNVRPDATLAAVNQLMEEVEEAVEVIENSSLLEEVVVRGRKRPLADPGGGFCEVAGSLQQRIAAKLLNVSRLRPSLKIEFVVTSSGTADNGSGSENACCGIASYLCSELSDRSTPERVCVHISGDGISRCHSDEEIERLSEALFRSKRLFHVTLANFKTGLGTILRSWSAEFYKNGYLDLSRLDITNSPAPPGRDDVELPTSSVPPPASESTEDASIALTFSFDTVGLSNLLLSTRSLEELNISYCRFGRDKLETLATGLVACPSIAILSLTDCWFSVDAIPVLARIFQETKAISDLHLSRSESNARDGICFGHIRSAQGRSASFHEDKLAQALVGLHHNRSVTNLDLSRCRLGKFEPIKELLRNNRHVESLLLCTNSNAPLGKNHLKNLAQGLARNSVLTSLSLVDVTLERGAMKTFTDTLLQETASSVTCSALDRLHFQASPQESFDAESLSHLTRWLRHPSCKVRQLCLANSELQKDSILALGECLRENAQLEKLDLSENYIDADGWKLFASFLSHTTSLKILVGGGIPELAQHDMLASLEQNRSLEKISLVVLDANGMPEVDAEFQRHIEFFTVRNRLCHIISKNVPVGFWPVILEQLSRNELQSRMQMVGLGPSLLFFSLKAKVGPFLSPPGHDDMPHPPKRQKKN